MKHTNKAKRRSYVVDFVRIEKSYGSAVILARTCDEAMRQADAMRGNDPRIQYFPARRKVRALGAYPE